MGTHSHKRENEVHLLRYDEDGSNRIEAEAVFSVDNGKSEIWSLSASPYDKDIVAIALSNTIESQYKVGLFNINLENQEGVTFDKKKLSPKLELGIGHHQLPIHSI